MEEYFRLLVFWCPKSIKHAIIARPELQFKECAMTRFLLPFLVLGCSVKIRTLHQRTCKSKCRWTVEQAWAMVPSVDERLVSNEGVYTPQSHRESSSRVEQSFSAFRKTLQSDEFHRKKQYIHSCQERLVSPAFSGRHFLQMHAGRFERRHLQGDVKAVGSETATFASFLQAFQQVDTFQFDIFDAELSADQKETVLSVRVDRGQLKDAIRSSVWTIEPF